MEPDSSSIVRLYKWLNTLSIDVCLGAIASGIMAMRLLDVHLGWAYWVVLPLAVWLVYTFDHLIDSYRAGNRATHDRRIFHQTYRRPIIYISAIILLLTAYISFSYLPSAIIIFGSILGVFTSLYLISVLIIPSKHSALFQKEVFVAFFYTAGVWGPLMVIKQSVTFNERLIICMFFLLAFCDLIMLSIIEFNADSKEGQHSIPLYFGRSRTRNLLYIIGITILAASVYVIIMDPRWINVKAAIILGVMQICLFLIFHFSKSLQKNYLYRNLSEAIFFLPALIFI